MAAVAPRTMRPHVWRDLRLAKQTPSPVPGVPQKGSPMKASCYRAFLAIGFCACALGSQVQAQTIHPRASSDEHSPQEAYDSGFSLDGVAEHEKPTADKYYRLLLRAREASVNDRLELSAELYKQLTNDNSY